MINKKTWLVIKVSKLNKSKIYEFSKLPYTKIFVLFSEDSEIEFKVLKKIELIKFSNLIDFNKKINQLYKDNIEYTILPYFSWDSNSKYAINIFNKTFSTNVNPKIFKEKNDMIDFLWDIIEKKYFKYSYKDLLNKKYEYFAKELWDIFIIKPTNWSSSMNTFKIKSFEDFENIKSKIAKSYDYIFEPYIWGNLYSIDFFFDWKDMFLLLLAREIAMIELSEKDKFSKEFLDKYWEELGKHFNFILPLWYNLDFSKLSKIELSFLEEIRKKLEGIWYRGVIHLEYKYDTKTQKIGFLEWWARYGWYRRKFIKKLYHTDFLRLPYNLLIEKDFSKFTKVKWNIFKFKENEYNLNFIRVKTNFINKINYIKILGKSWDLFKNSFEWFLNNYYKTKFWINIKKIDFFVHYSKNYNFFPFYKNNKTKFDYILELDDENFKIFRNKKFKIIEDIFFHDYKK